MKKNAFVTLLAAGAITLASCSNSEQDTTAANDTNTRADNTASGINGSAATTETASSTGDYAAYANELETGSAQGRYINPRTGKAYKKLSVNRETGEVMDENNQPVYRYVDNTNWWVYGLDDSDWTWRRMGEAKMDQDRLTYKNDSGSWVDYDARWKTDDDKMGKSWKTKSGDTKIKVDKDGDIKIKNEDGKVKYDADDNKVKTDKDN